MERPLYYPLKYPPTARFEGIAVSLGEDWTKFTDNVPEGYEPAGAVRLPERKRAALFVQGEKFVTARRGEIVEMNSLDAFFTKNALQKAAEHAEDYAQRCKWKKTATMVGLAREARWLSSQQKRLQVEAPQMDTVQFDRARVLSRQYPTPRRTAELAALISEMNLTTLLMYLGHMGLFGERTDTAVIERLMAIRNELFATTEGEKA